VSGKSLGTDQDGIIRLCGPGDSGNAAVSQQVTPTGKPPPPPPPPTVLPAGMRSWECVPGVIRDDGVDSFRLEVDANGVVGQVILSLAPGSLAFVSGTNSQNLHDDGLNGDRIAGDRIFTSERIRYNGSSPFGGNLYGDPLSPAGILFESLGDLSVVETNGVTNRFLIGPTVGLLSTAVPLAESHQLGSNVLISPHLVNVSTVFTNGRQTQKAIRAGSMSSMNGVTSPVYSILPDAFDFFIFFSMDHVESVPFSGSSGNFVAGAHLAAQVKYTGTGLATNNNQSGYFGSSGRLLGLNILDTATHGISDGICTHELLHQWVSFTSGSLGLNFDGSHYSAACSANSLVGGTHWTPGSNGTFITDCDERAFGQAQAPPLDKYMMGLIPGSSVPPLYVASDVTGCYVVVTNYRTVTIADIQALHGVRTPTPPNAQKSFSLCFVAESFNRALTPAEMTFYDMLAAQYTKPVPAGEPSPRLQGSWRTIDRYFGEGSQWSTEVLGVIRPNLKQVERLGDGTVRITGAGWPGRSYRLLTAINQMTSWVSATNQLASPDGNLIFNIPFIPLSTPRFFRLATP